MRLHLAVYNFRSIHFFYLPLNNESTHFSHANLITFRKCRLGTLCRSFLLIAFLSTCSFSEAQCNLSTKMSTSGNVTTYTYTLTGVPADAATPAAGAPPAPCTAGNLPVSLSLPVDKAFLPASVAPPTTPGSTALSNEIDGATGLVVNIDQQKPQSIYTFTISAQTNLSSTSTTSSYIITFHDKSVATGQVSVPLKTNPDQITDLAGIATDPNTVDILVGTGSHITFGPYPDYNVEASTVLVSTGVGNATPAILLGAGFTTGVDLLRKNYWNGVGKSPSDAKWDRLKRNSSHVVPDSIFVSLQAAIGSNSASTNSIVGYTFGGGYKIQHFVEVLVGYSLAQYSEPSTGFRQAAAATVTNNQNVPIYKQYSASDIMKDIPNSLDGFPLLLQTVTSSGTPGQPAGPIYGGSVLLNHYRGGLFLGLAYPFSLSKVLLGK
jgi:hypothetical protein